MGLVKAEILWTRKCPLSCSYCAMPNDTERAPVASMIAGLSNLKELGVGFIAIYGASPLYDFEGLPEYIKAAEDMDILTTVITDGVQAGHRGLLEELYDSGLRSLTMSYDFVPYDNASRIKTGRAFALVDWWLGLPDIRDVEIVATVTSENYDTIINALPQIFMNYPKLYFSFDFVHFDRMNPGTKCKGQANDLALTNQMVADFCNAMLEFKIVKDFNIHASLDVLRKFADNPTIVTEYSWSCATDNFPSWVTIDADGTVLPCDDFHVDRSLKVWDIDELKWTLWKHRNKKDVEDFCNGCAWNTHIDADLIKGGQVSFLGYVHKE